MSGRDRSREYDRQRVHTITGLPDTLRGSKQRRESSIDAYSHVRIVYGKFEQRVVTSSCCYVVQCQFLVVFSL